MSEHLSIEAARDLVDEATRYHSTPWKRVMTNGGGFYGVTDRTGSVVAASPAVSALIAAAPTLITELLARLEAAEQQVQRVREVCESDAHEWSNEYGSNDWVTVENILEALDGDTGD